MSLNLVSVGLVWVVSDLPLVGEGEVVVAEMPIVPSVVLTVFHVMVTMLAEVVAGIGELIIEI
jgi:hypothetical protein